MVFIKNGIILPNQSGFKPGDSCVNQHLSTTHEIYKSFDGGFDIRSVFLDIWKTFYKVWQEGSNFNSLWMPSSLTLFISQTWISSTFSRKCSKRWPVVMNSHFSAFSFIYLWLNHLTASWELFCSFSITTFKELPFRLPWRSFSLLNWIGDITLSHSSLQENRRLDFFFNWLLLESVK